MPARDPNAPPRSANKPQQPAPAEPAADAEGATADGAAGAKETSDGAMARRDPAPRRPDRRAGLSEDQETVLVAIGHAMENLKAHGDAISQWRLAQVEAALSALDRGAHRQALDLVDRAATPDEDVPSAERQAAERLERRLHADELRAALEARRARGAAAG